MKQIQTEFAFGATLEQLVLARLADSLDPALKDAKDQRYKLRHDEIWPDQYIHSERGKPYVPHGEDEEKFVFTDAPRAGLIKGGEGSGKSTAAVIKNLNRVRRGMDGIMVSPDLEHFKKSLWPEFRRWCPYQAVVERERYRLNPEWEPSKSFALHFISSLGTTSTLHCGGIEDPSGWTGPNVSFAHFDEAHRQDKPAALKVLDGRVRISGPNGEPPQLYLTTIPAMHWLWDYFGPISEDEEEREKDEHIAFKESSSVITLITEDNERAGNLAEGYTKDRAKSLTESEIRVLLGAEWESIDDVSHFVNSIIWWDGCKESLEPMDARTPLVAAADAGVTSDAFGFVAVSKHPDLSRNDSIAVRYEKAWEPKKGEALDFDEIEDHIIQFCKAHNVLEIAYDPYQLHQMMTGLRTRKIVDTYEFKQGVDRAIADKALLDRITQRQIAHSGEVLLRRHIDNADKKITQDRMMRIVKRNQRLKIDLAVTLSMAAYRSQFVLKEKKKWRIV